MGLHTIYIFAQLIASFSSCHSYVVQRDVAADSSLTLTNIAAAIHGSANSEAHATGIGSTVGVNGMVSGDSSTSGGVHSSENATLSSVSFQGNCSDSSNSFAEGATTADAVASGNCTYLGDNPTAHENSISERKYAYGLQTPAGEGSSETEGQHIIHEQVLVTQATGEDEMPVTLTAYQLASSPETPITNIMGAATGN